MGKAARPPPLPQAGIAADHKGVVFLLGGHIGLRPDLVAQFQQGLEQFPGRYCFRGDGNAGVGQLGDGPLGVEEHTAGPVGAGNAEPAYRLKAILFAESVPNRHRRGVDKALLNVGGRRLRPGIHQLQTPPLGVKVKGFANHIGDPPHFQRHRPLPPFRIKIAGDKPGRPVANFKDTVKRRQGKDSWQVRNGRRRRSIYQRLIP